MEWFHKRRKQAILIQRVWRGIANFNGTLKVLAQRKQARLKLQRAFKWHVRWKFVIKEVERRVVVKRELAEKMR